MAVSVAVATAVLAAGAAAAAASDPGALSDIQLGTPAPSGEPVDKSVPASAEGLSTRLVKLSSPRLAGAGNARQAAAVDLPRAGGDSLQHDDGGLIVQARVEQTSDSMVDSLRAAGAEIIFISHRYGTVDLAIAAQRLRDLTAVPGVSSVIELLQPAVNRSGTAGAAAAEPQIAPPCGAVISEGDTQLRAAAARSTYELDGAGVKVGVISDSYNKDASAPTTASGDTASGDLPGPGNPCGRTTSPQILADTIPAASATDEGRAMMQIVHDMAPGARLAFADAANSQEAFANRIRALSAAGAQVIVDDISYTAEPMYQDGPISVAVNDVTADGRTYFSSAANSNVIVAGRNVGSFEAPAFRDAGPCTDGFISISQCMDFDPEAATDNSFCFEMAAGTQFGATMQWAEPRDGVTTDLDIHLYDVAAAAFVTGGRDNNLATQLPFEFVQVANPTAADKIYCIVVEKFAGTSNPRFKFILSRARLTAVEYLEAKGSDVIGPSIYGHNGAANAVSVAAVPFSNSNTLESFSSYGPVRLTHGPVSGTTAAPPLAAPQVLAKPDIAATDGNRTTFFVPTGSPNEFRFFGTSAAAPHAAGVAALEVQAKPSATPSQIKQAQFSTARAVGSLPATGTGAGLVDAVGALDAVGAVVPPPPPPLDLILAARAKQAVKKLQVRATCSNTCALRVVAIGKAKKKRKKGKKKKTIRFKTEASAGLQADTPTKVKLPLRGRKARRVSRLPGKVTFRAVAGDAFGQTATAVRRVKLKPKR